MLKSCKFLVLVLVSVMIFSSCGNKLNLDDLEDETESIKIKFLNAWGAREECLNTMHVLINEFKEENLLVDIDIESVLLENYYTKVKTMFAARNQPDVFGYWPGLDMDGLIKSGKIADLTRVLNNDEEWKAIFSKDVFEYTKYEDKIYGIPFERIYLGLLVNKEMFNKYKVKIPVNYDELKQAVKVFRENNIDPISYNASVEGSYIFQSIVAALGGKDGVSKPFGINNESFYYIQGIKVMKELYDMKAFPKKCFTINNVDKNKSFINKNIPMIVQSSEFYEELNRSNEWVEFVPFPEFDKKQGRTMIYGFGSGCYYLSNKAWMNSEKRSKSIDFIKKLTSKKAAEMFEKNNNMFTSINTNSKFILPKFIQNGKNYINDKSIQKIDVQDRNISRVIWENIIVRKFPYVLENRTSPDSLWNEAKDMENEKYYGSK